MTIAIIIILRLVGISIVDHSDQCPTTPVVEDDACVIYVNDADQVTYGPLFSDDIQVVLS